MISNSHSKRNYHTVMETRISENEQRLAQLVAQQDPALTFEHREPPSSRTINSEEVDNNGYQARTNFNYLGSGYQPESMETSSFRMKNNNMNEDNGLVQNQVIQDEEEEDEQDQATQESYDAYEQQTTEQDYNRKEEIVTYDDLTPVSKKMKNYQQREINIAESNKKLKERNDEIEQEFEQQCYGSQPPSSKLIVACIIRQPMDTVGLKSKYKSLHSESTNSIMLGKSSGGVQSAIFRDNSQGPSLNRLSLNRSSNGLDLSKSSSVSGSRAKINRIRGHSQDTRSNRSNHSAGAKRHSKSQNKQAKDQA